MVVFGSSFSAVFCWFGVMWAFRVARMVCWVVSVSWFAFSSCFGVGFFGSSQIDWRWGMCFWSVWASWVVVSGVSFGCSMWDAYSMSAHDALVSIGIVFGAIRCGTMAALAALRLVSRWLGCLMTVSGGWGRVG